MSSTRDELEFAYKLIKRDKMQDALDLLRPIVTMEPDNVHAWWLMAYAATEPQEVREALLQVLRVDPDYANAPKAREMLLQLNQEYPPSPEEIEHYPELETEYNPLAAPPPVDIEPAEKAEEIEAPVSTPSLEEPLPIDEIEAEIEAEAGLEADLAFEPESDEEIELPPFAAVPAREIDLASIETLDALEPPEDLFESVQFVDSEEDLFSEEDPFADLDEDLLAVEDDAFADEALATLAFEEAIFPEPSFADLTPEFPDDGLATPDETPARQRERGMGLFLMAVIVILIAAGAVLVVYYVMTQDDDNEASTDAGALQALAFENEQIANAQAVVEAQLPNIAPGDQGGAVVASSELGNTFFVELCGAPSPGLTDLVTNGMVLAAEQALLLQDQVSAIGVTVDECQTGGHDVLYRSVVPLDHALRYANGEITWDEFLAFWITP